VVRDELGERGFTHGGAGLTEMAAWILGSRRASPKRSMWLIVLPFTGLWKWLTVRRDSGD
jgi:hypothetical protein